jgi:protein-S-isoprenylcysteine O-methyltransferase Ste14
MGIMIQICQIVALVIVGSFYAIYLQRQFALRRRGIRADRLGKGEKERTTRVVEMALLIVTFAMPAVQVASIVFWGSAAGGASGAFGAFGGAAFGGGASGALGGAAFGGGASGAFGGAAPVGLFFAAPLWLSLLGAAIALAGVVFFLLAVVAMRDNWRAGIDRMQKTELVTRGVYRISRNPAFVGFDLFYVGIAAMFPNPVLIALSLVALAGFHLQILQEERYAPEAFGADYTRYARRTRRYL